MENLNKCGREWIVKRAVFVLLSKFKKFKNVYIVELKALVYHSECKKCKIKG